MMEKKMIIFSAPSGSGKTTILKEILKGEKIYSFSISACNREARKGEEHGRDYYFLSTEDFEARIKNGDFIEWEEVYEGRYYGTLKSELERIWSEGKIVLFDIDVVGGLNIKKMYGDKALALFIKAPSLDSLKDRLIARNTDDEESIQMRLNKAEEEISYAPDFDYTIVNDDLTKAVNETKAVIDDFLNA